MAQRVHSPAGDSRALAQAAEYLVSPAAGEGEHAALGRGHQGSQGLGGLLRKRESPLLLALAGLHGQQATGQVHIGPVQGHNLRRPEPGVGAHQHQGPLPRVTGGEEPVELGLGVGPALLPRGRGVTDAHLRERVGRHHAAPGQGGHEGAGAREADVDAGGLKPEGLEVARVAQGALPVQLMWLQRGGLAPREQSEQAAVVLFQGVPAHSEPLAAEGQRVAPHQGGEGLAGGHAGRVLRVGQEGVSQGLGRASLAVLGTQAGEVLGEVEGLGGCAAGQGVLGVVWAGVGHRWASLSSATHNNPYGQSASRRRRRQTRTPAHPGRRRRPGIGPFCGAARGSFPARTRAAGTGRRSTALSRQPHLHAQCVTERSQGEGGDVALPQRQVAECG